VPARHWAGRAETNLRELLTQRRPRCGVHFSRVSCKVVVTRATRQARVAWSLSDVDFVRSSVKVARPEDYLRDPSLSEDTSGDR